MADRITVKMDATAKTANTLIYTSCELLKADQGVFEAKCYGINQFLFKNLTKDIKVLCSDKEIAISTVKDGEYTLISFDGIENVKIEMI